MTNCDHQGKMKFNEDKTERYCSACGRILLRRKTIRPNSKRWIPWEAKVEYSKNMC